MEYNILGDPAYVGDKITITVTLSVSPTLLTIYIRRNADTRQSYIGTPTGNGWSLVSGNTYKFEYLTTEEGRYNIRLEATDGTDTEIIQAFFNVKKDNTQ